MAPKCLPPELSLEFMLFIPVEDAIPNVLSSCCLLHNILRPRVIKWEKKMQKLIDEFGKFRRDFDGFRGEVRRDFSEVRRDFDGFRGEFDGFRGEFDGFRGEVRTELSTMKNRFEVLDKPFGQLPVSPQTLEHNWAQFIDYLVQANNGVTGRMATLTNAVERLNAGDTDEADKLYGDVTALDSDCTDLAEMVHRIAQLPNVAQATQLATLVTKVTCDKSQLFNIRLELMRKEDGEQRMRRKAQQILHKLEQVERGISDCLCSDEAPSFVFLRQFASLEGDLSAIGHELNEFEKEFFALHIDALSTGAELLKLLATLRIKKLDLALKIEGQRREQFSLKQLKDYNEPQQQGSSQMTDQNWNSILQEMDRNKIEIQPDAGRKNQEKVPKKANKGTMTEDKRRSSLSSLAHRRSSVGIKVSTGVKPLHVRVGMVVAARAIHLTWSVPKGVVDYDKISAYVVRYKVDDGEGAADSAVGGGPWKFASKRQHVAAKEYEDICKPLCPGTSYKICIWVEDRHGKPLHTHKLNARTNLE